MGGAERPHRGGRRAVRRHLRRGRCGLPPPPDAPGMDQDGKRRRRAPGPHRHRGRRHHRHRRRVLHHDPGVDPGVAAVRPPHDAQLRARHRQPGHARRLRRDVRLLGARPGHRQQPQRERHRSAVRPLPVDLGGRGPPLRRPRGADLLHPPHRQVDPVARGDRRHRGRPDALHRCRVPRPGGRDGEPCRAPRGEVGARSPATDRGAGSRRALTGQRLHPVRRATPS